MCEMPFPALCGGPTALRCLWPLRQHHAPLVHHCGLRLYAILQLGAPIFATFTMDGFRAPSKGVDAPVSEALPSAANNPRVTRGEVECSSAHAGSFPVSLGPVTTPPGLSSPDLVASYHGEHRALNDGTVPLVEDLTAAPSGDSLPLRDDVALGCAIVDATALKASSSGDARPNPRDIPSGSMSVERDVAAMRLELQEREIFLRGPAMWVNVRSYLPISSLPSYYAISSRFRQALIAIRSIGASTCIVCPMVRLFRVAMAFQENVGEVEDFCGVCQWHQGPGKCLQHPHVWHALALSGATPIQIEGYMGSPLSVGRYPGFTASREIQFPEAARVVAGHADCCSCNLTRIVGNYRRQLGLSPSPCNGDPHPVVCPLRVHDSATTEEEWSRATNTTLCSPGFVIDDEGHAVRRARLERMLRGLRAPFWAADQARALTRWGDRDLEIPSAAYRDNRHPMAAEAFERSWLGTAQAPGPRNPRGHLWFPPYLSLFAAAHFHDAALRLRERVALHRPQEAAPEPEWYLPAYVGPICPTASIEDGHGAKTIRGPALMHWAEMFPALKYIACSMSAPAEHLYRESYEVIGSCGLYAVLAALAPHHTAQWPRLLPLRDMTTEYDLSPIAPASWTGITVARMLAMAQHLMWDVSVAAISFEFRKRGPEGEGPHAIMTPERWRLEEEATEFDPENCAADPMLQVMRYIPGAPVILYLPASSLGPAHWLAVGAMHFGSSNGRRIAGLELMPLGLTNPVPLHLAMPGLVESYAPALAWDMAARYATSQGTLAQGLPSERMCLLSNNSAACLAAAVQAARELLDEARQHDVRWPVEERQDRDDMEEAEEAARLVLAAAENAAFQVLEGLYVDNPIFIARSMYTVPHLHLDVGFGDVAWFIGPTPPLPVFPRGVAMHWCTTGASTGDSAVIRDEFQRRYPGATMCTHQGRHGMCTCYARQLASHHAMRASRWTATALAAWTFAHAREQVIWLAQTAADLGTECLATVVGLPRRWVMEPVEPDPAPAWWDPVVFREIWDLQVEGDEAHLDYGGPPDQAGWRALWARMRGQNQLPARGPRVPRGLFPWLEHRPLLVPAAHRGEPLVEMELREANPEGADVEELEEVPMVDIGNAGVPIRIVRLLLGRRAANVALSAWSRARAATRYLAPVIRAKAARAWWHCKRIASYAPYVILGPLLVAYLLLGILAVTGLVIAMTVIIMAPVIKAVAERIYIWVQPRSARPHIIRTTYTDVPMDCDYAVLTSIDAHKIEYTVDAPGVTLKQTVHHPWWFGSWFWSAEERSMLGARSPTEEPGLREGLHECSWMWALTSELSPYPREYIIHSLKGQPLVTPRIIQTVEIAEPCASETIAATHTIPLCRGRVPMGAPTHDRSTAEVPWCEQVGRIPPPVARLDVWRRVRKERRDERGWRTWAAWACATIFVALMVAWVVSTLIHGIATIAFICFGLTSGVLNYAMKLPYLQWMAWLPGVFDYLGGVAVGSVDFVATRYVHHLLTWTVQIVVISGPVRALSRAVWSLLGLITTESIHPRTSSVIALWHACTAFEFVWDFVLATANASNPAGNPLARLVSWLMAVLMAYMCVYGRCYVWHRRSQRSVARHLLSTVGLHRPEELVAKFYVRWADRDPLTAMPRMVELITQDMTKSATIAGNGHFPTGAQEALALLLIPVRENMDAAFSDHNYTRTMVRAAKRIGFTNRRVARVRICNRPGCGAVLPKGKQKNALCGDCDDSRRLPPEGPALLYASAVALNRDQPLDGFAAIPAYNLPLNPDVRQEDGVLVVEQPGWAGPHALSCPAAVATRKDLKDGSVVCTCSEQRIKGVGQAPVLGKKIASVGVGFLADGVPPITTDKAHPTCLRTLLARVARLREVRPKPGQWRASSALRSAQVLCGKWHAVQVQAMTLDEWKNAFPAARRVALDACDATWKACGSYVDRGFFDFYLLTKLEHLTSVTTSSCGLYKIPVTTMKPRGIQAPKAKQAALADVSHLLVGPAMRSMTHSLKEIWTNQNLVFYASTKPELVNQWLGWASKVAACWIWADYVMFDMTHSEDTWAFLEELYKIALDPTYYNAEYFSECMRRWRAPAGKAFSDWEGWRVLVKYWAVAMNASGRDDTALANALLNGIAMCLSLAQLHFDLPLEELQEHHLDALMGVFMVAVVGDDSLIAAPETTAAGRPWSTLIDALVGKLAEFGFQAKIGFSYRIVDAVFLGCRPYRVGGRWWFGPTIGRRMFKHHVMLGNTRDPIAWLHGVTKMEARTIGFVPLLGAMARRCNVLLRGKKRTEFKHGQHNKSLWAELEGAPLKPDRETYEYAALAYTTDVSTCSAMEFIEEEAAIGEVVALPHILSGPLIRKVLLVDDL